MKLPSIESLLSLTVATVRRFPLAILSALTATCILIYLTHNNWEFREGNYFVLSKILMCSQLGLCLFLSATLISEARQHSPAQKIIMQAATFALIGVYFLTIGQYEKFTIDTFTRFSLYVIGSHLLVSFAPFTGSNHINGFWQFNKTLFLRFLLSMLYTCVLYAGIALGLWLIDLLLHVDIRYTKYLYTWYVLAYAFNTTVFLAGIPTNIHELDSDTSYPKGLKTFTQFVLLTLVTLYLLILYAYLCKILIHWKLPVGYVSYLVLSISIAGILSLLLIYPIRNNEENKWIKIFSRWFYVALYPLIGLLGVAIFKRISDYGITENRYFILILATWLVFMAAYFLISKKDNIKLIPISLSVLALLTSIGPWGAFSVAQHSQKGRLEKLLVKNGILVNGQIKKAGGSVNDSDAGEIESIVRYLDKSNALDVIQPWFNRNFDSIKKIPPYYYYSYKTDTIMDMLGVRSYGEYGRYGRYLNTGEGSSLEFNRFGGLSNGAIEVKGFDYYYHVDYSDYSVSTSERIDTNYRYPFYLDSVEYEIAPSLVKNKFWILHNWKNVASMQLDSLITFFKSKYDTSTSTAYYLNVPSEKMNYDLVIDSIFVRFCFKSITTRQQHSTSVINYFVADVLSKHK